VKGNCDVVNAVKDTNREGIIEMTKPYDQFKKNTIIKISDERSLGYPIFNDHMMHGRLLRASLFKKHGIKFPEHVVKSEDRCCNKWFWCVAKTAGICVTEKYKIMLHDPKTQLHLIDVGVDDEYNMLVYLLQNIMTIPEAFVPLNKKAIVFNKWFQSKYIVEMSKSPRHIKILKSKYGRYLKILKDTNILHEKAIPFIDLVLK